MNYTFLKTEDLPDSLRDKPKWMSCLIVAAGLLFLTLAAVAVGAIFGYTYCYIEHRGMKYGWISVKQPSNTGLLEPPYPETEDARYNRTLSGALSSTFMSKIKMIGHTFMDDSAGRRRNDLNETVTSSI